jgi:hypothetical protein
MGWCRSPPAERVGGRSVDMEGSGDEENVTCQVGTVQGEDYTFRFGGKIVDGKLHFRLHMEYEGEDDEVNGCHRILSSVRQLGSRRD